MTVRTIPDSVVEVSGPPPDVHVLEATLRGLRGRHRGAVLERYLGKVPTIADDAYVAPGAVLIGDVTLGVQASVWAGCVLRGDLASIVVGARSNLQDGTVVHLGDDDPTVVGEDVIVGHRAVLHGCTLHDACLVGIQATLLDGVVVGRGSVIGAGSVVTAGTVIPPYSLVLGVPGRVVKTLGTDVEDFHRRLAAKYVRLAYNHRHG